MQIFVIEGEFEAHTVLILLAFAFEVDDAYRTIGDRRAEPLEGHRGCLQGTSILRYS